MPVSDPCSLCETEGRKIYAAVFGCEIPPTVLERFVGAAKRLNATVPQPEVDRCTRALLACPDLEALELVARYSRRLPLLSRKFQLMAYLAETLPENQPRFINQRSSFLGGLLSVAGAGLRTAWKMVAGLWLLRSVPRD